MRSGQLTLVGLLSLVIVASGIGVVYAKYLSRKYFVELQVLQAEAESLGVEWGRLQLEESTLATHAKVESTARGRLGMHLPRIEEVRVIRR
ncbi:MAG: cell division protein FtsL [Chromatiales bacterium]|jgi:cell division protein FtsL